MKYCKHDIRNALWGYRLERNHLLQDLTAITEKIDRMDQHILRMESALNSCAYDVSYSPSIWERIKYGLWFLRKN